LKFRSAVEKKKQHGQKIEAPKGKAPSKVINLMDAPPHSALPSDARHIVARRRTPRVHGTSPKAG
jgi:hypothetical protein